MWCEVGRQRVNDDRTACDVSPKQGPLRSAQHLDALQIEEIRIVVTDSSGRNIINENGDTQIRSGRVIADGRAADGRVGFLAAQRRKSHAGRDDGDIAEVLSVLSINFSAADGRNRNRRL